MLASSKRGMRDSTGMTHCSLISYRDATLASELVCVDTARTTDIVLFRLDVGCRSFVGDYILVTEDKQGWVGAEVTIKIFKCSIGSFRVEEVDGRNKCKIEHCPDDVESPM